MQEETNSFLKAIEEANKKMEAAELSLEEKDQRIGELDRLIERMEKVTDTAWACCPLPSALGPTVSLKTCLESEASVLTSVSAPSFQCNTSCNNTEGS